MANTTGFESGRGLADEFSWQPRALGDCAKWYSGGTPHKGTSAYWGGSIPWISAKSLTNFSIADSEGRVTDAGARNGTRMVPKDTILFIVRGMSLKTEFRIGITTRPVTFNQDLKALVAVDDVAPLFLAYAIRSKTPEILNLVGEAGHGTGVLPTDRIQALEIPIPPLDEQRRIAAVLGALDDKIELNRKMNQTLEDTAQAIFKSWFIDFDGHDPKDMVDSELGPIPRGWGVGTLAGVTSKIGSGATPRGGREVYVDEGVRLIRSQNVYDHEFSWPGLVCLTDEAAKRLQNVSVERDDVLINITGDSILRTCVVDPDVLPARVNQHVAILRASRIPARFLHLWLVRDWTKEFLLGHSAGATRKAITKGHLEGTPILIPPAERSLAFAAITDEMFERINLARSESRTLESLRDALLPKLTSGEIRV